MTDDRRSRSYKVGAHVTRERMRTEAPEDLEALEAVEASDVIVVADTYDHVETVLDALGTPHTVVSRNALASLRLRPEQLLIVNCPGNIGTAGVDTVRRFVEDGGSLFTTDWALRNVIEPAFPGIASYNDHPTADAVVAVEVVSTENPFVRGVIDQGDEPVWWLEGSSYPIVIHDTKKVQVLLQSRELAERWGEAPVAITFPFGKGEVFHMISHYYLQRTETRSRRHTQTAASYAAGKGVAMSAPMMADAADLDLVDVEAAYSSSRSMANVIAEKKKRHMKGRNG